MNITRIFLESFGKYQNTEIKFKPGINLIYGTNEKGKSTLHMFIEAMFFSFNKHQYNSPDYLDKYLRYRPWKNKDVFAGELDYMEKGKFIQIFRNFLSEDEISVYENNIKLKSFLEKKLESSKNHDSIHTANIRQESLQILGITDISNKTGNSLVNEMKNQILSIRNANSGIISLDVTLENLSKHIERLENNKEYFQLTKQLEYYNEKVVESETLQKLKKDYIQEYYDKLAEMNEIQAELVRLRTNIKNSEEIEMIKKFHLLSDLNDEIIQTKDQLVQLEPYIKLNLDEVELFLKTKEKINICNEEIRDLEVKIEDAQSKQERITNDLPKEVIMTLNDDEFTNSFINKYLEILNIQKELAEVEQEIIDKEEQIREEGNGIVYTPKEAKAKSEKLENDYYKFINMVSWKDQIQQEQDMDNRGKISSDIIIKLEDKKLTYRIFMLASQIISSISVLVMFAKPSLTLVLLFFIIVGFGSSIFFKFQQSKIRQDLINQKYELSSIDEEKKKSMIRINSVSEHIAEILKMFKCESQEEFKNYVKQKKLEYENIIIYGKELAIKNEKKEMIVGEIMSEEYSIRDYIDSLQFFQDQIMSVNIKNYEKILFSIEESKEYRNLDNALVFFNKELNEARTNLLKYSEILKNPLIQSLEIETIIEYQSKREEWIRINESLSTLIAQRKELLDGEAEEDVIKRGNELVAMNGDFNGENEYNIEKLKELVKVKEETFVKLKMDCMDAKHETERIANSQVAHSIIREKIDELNGKIRIYLEEIALYSDALDMIKKASSSISLKFRDELKKTIHSVVSEVVGSKYEVIIDDEMRLKVKDKDSEKIVDIENLSLGTIDQIYFALRIGLINSVNQEMNIPLILDDCFVHYDGQRLEQMLLQVAELNRQVIMLSCHEREKQIFDKLSIPINYIEL